MMLKFTPTCKNTNDEYFEPWGVTADPDGLFVVSDHHNHRLQVGLSKSDVVIVKVSAIPTVNDGGWKTTVNVSPYNWN